MADASTDGARPGGVLRLTWMSDQLAHVLALWSAAWSANYETLKLLQTAGLTRFAPARPQRWVIASFEHHCGPHGLPHPHVHNIVITRLTTEMPRHPCNSGSYG